MFVLFVDMNVKPGSQQALEKTYSEIFRPAISRQEGFRDVELLRPNQDGGEYRLRIAFESMLCRKNGWQAIFIRKYGRKWKATVRTIPSTTTPRFRPGCQGALWNATFLNM